ncbi:MAG TPA: serine/threonine-protein kinase [Acidimicrobiales bacterium]|nr:serine/threonine-protein kinase [Acidimicrobiales bacterium]
MQDVSNGGDGAFLGIGGIDTITEIGRSATHTTYRVRDVASGRMVVIKLLNAAREWPGLEERFEREQTAMAALHHPSIVQVYGHGWSDTGMPYIVAAEETGGSIADRLSGPTPMTGPDILSLGVRLAGALESAHRSDVVHGDLRPEDMMLSAQGEPLVADFGLVTLVRPNAADVTNPADLAHVAPELLEGRPASAESDVYALCSALFTLFNGAPAYVRPDDRSIIPVIKRISSDPLPDLAAKNVPAPVVEALARGMAKDPAERHRNAQDLGRSLQQAQVALGLPMTEMVLLGTPRPTKSATAGAVPVTATATAVPPPPVVTTTGPPASGPNKPNRTPLIVGIVIGVLAIALLAFLLTRGGDDKKTAATTTTTTRPTTSTTTTSTTTTTTSASGDVELLTNDGGQIEADVPTSWSDHDTAPTSNGAPSLRASTNLTEATAGTYKAPAVELVAFDPTVIDPNNLDGALDAIVNLDRTGGTLASICTRGQRNDFTPLGENLDAGRLERLTTCNGGGDVIIAAATDVGKTFTVLVEVHVGDPADDAGVDVVMSSFNVVKFP